MSQDEGVTPRGLDEAATRQLCRRVLEAAAADQTRVNVSSGWRGFTRTATNRITTAGGSSDTTVRITSRFGKREASVTTNRLDSPHLEEAVRESESLAQLAPENPESLPELGPQDYPSVNGYYSSTDQLDPVRRAEAAAMAVRAASEADLVAAGYMDVRAGATAVATSAGLFAYHRATGVASTLTARTPDGGSSGWAGDEAADWNEIESERIARDAVRKCLRWRNPTSLEPGRYPVVMEPTAVGMLMLRMRGAFSARQADEGRSSFSRPGGGNRLGEKLFDSRITLRSDPAAANAETAPFTAEGQPVTAVDWVREGVLTKLAYSRFWAERNGAEPQAAGSNLLMAGGSASLEDMIRSTRRGVLITRFWYIRGLDPRTLSYTGLTRDGTFLIEDGRLSRPVNNFRFNQSLTEMLSQVEALGEPTRVAASENSSVSTPVVVPPMKVRNFNLASVSEAI